MDGGEQAGLPAGRNFVAEGQLMTLIVVALSVVGELYDD